MTNCKFLTKLATILLTIAVLLDGCTSPVVPHQVIGTDSQNPYQQFKSLKIGALLPLSSDTTGLSLSAKHGLELAVDDINASGGISSLGGALIELVWGDSQGKAEIAQSELTRMVQQESVVAIIDTDSSENIFVASRESERLSTPFIVTQAVADNLTSSDLKYTFRICPNASGYAKSVTEFLKDLGKLAGLNIQKVALIHADTDQANLTAGIQQKFLQENGIGIGIELKYSAKPGELINELAQIKSSNVDAILTNVTTNDLALIAKARNDSGLAEVPFIDTSGSPLDPIILSQGGSAFEGWFAASAYSKFVPGTEALNNRFKARYNSDITSAGVYAYQAGWVIAEALQSSASIDPSNLRAALSKLSIPSGTKMVLAAQNLRFDNNGQITSNPIFIVQAQGNEFYPIWPTSVAARSPVVGK